MKPKANYMSFASIYPLTRRKYCRAIEDLTEKLQECFRKSERGRNVEVIMRAFRDEELLYLLRSRFVQSMHYFWISYRNNVYNTFEEVMA